MQRVFLFLLAVSMIFILCGCDLSDFLSMDSDWLPAFSGNETTLPPAAEPPTAPPQPTAEPLLWDPALYEAILEEAAKTHSDTQDSCYYLLYDITQDEIPELMLKTDTDKGGSIYRIFTIRDGATFLLGEYDASLGELCGYHSGDGILICDMTHHDSLTYVMLITCNGEALNTEVVLDHYEFIKNRFTPLDTWRLTDASGLDWKSNPEDISKTYLDSLRKEELRLHTDILDDLSDEEVRRMNLFLSNFSEQNMKNLSFFQQYDYLYFVFNYCTINRKDMLSYSNGYAYITLDDANHVLNQYFGTTFEPEENDMYFSDTQGSDIIYQNGKLRYKAGTEKTYHYVTVVTEVINGKNGTYEVTYHVYSVKGYAPDKYYRLRPEEVDQHPEMKLIYWGYANIKDYVRTNGVPSYQLVSYTPVTD